MDITIERAGLNNIELPDLMIAELYRNTLIAPDASSAFNIPHARLTTSTPIVTSAPDPFPAGATAPSSTQSVPASQEPAAPPKKPATAPQPLSPEPQSAAPSLNSIAAASQNIAPSASPAAATTSSAAIPSTAAAIASSPAASSTAAPSTAATPSPAAQKNSGPYKFLGANQKKITIIIQSPGMAFLPDEQLTVLTKMLEACRMNMADIAMVNHAVLPVKIAELKEQLAPRIVLLFGLQPVEIALPINFPQFKIQAYDQCTYLYAPSLEEMTGTSATSRSIKTQLWGCLKTLFEI